MRFVTKYTGSLEGQMLVASPGMDDPRFDRSVVLVLHHGPVGALGVVLNRPAEEDAGQWVAKLKAQLKQGQPLFVGGPVGGSIIALQVSAVDWASVREQGDQAVLLRKEEPLDSVLQKVPQNVRVFVGHAVWSQGQLEREVAGGMWHTLPADPALLHEDRQAMWVEAIRRIGRRFYQEVFHIRHFPDDVTLN